MNYPCNSWKFFPSPSLSLSLSRCAAIEMSDENPLHHMDSVVFIAYHRQMWSRNIPQIWNILDFVYRSSMRLSDLPPTPRTYSASQWVFLSEQKAVTIVIVKIFFFFLNSVWADCTQVSKNPFRKLTRAVAQWVIFSKKK